MTHGAEDYTRITSAKVVAATIDFDLPVILIDRFDSANFLWAAAGAPIDYDAGMEAGAAYEGDAGMALRTSLAAVGAGEWVSATRYAFTTPTRKLSFSALFRVNQDNTLVREILFRVTGRRETHDFNAAFRYRPVDEAWDYLNNAAIWVEFLPAIVQDWNTWQRVYFELDVANAQYIAFETADRRITLTGEGITLTMPPGIERTLANIRVTNEVIGTRADVSFDDIIIKELGS